MANSLPVPKDPVTAALITRWSDRVIIRIAQALFLGESKIRLARRLAKGDPRRTRYWQYRLVEIGMDPRFQMVMLGLAKGDAYLSLGTAMRGANRAAARGEMQGVRWLGEVTGLHNPRVEHDHTGNIEVTINMPRPPARVDADGTVAE